MASGNYTFWVTDATTRVDTGDLLVANEPLRQATDAVGHSVTAVANALASMQGAYGIGLDGEAMILAEALQQARVTLQELHDTLVLLLAWRERAAQIYAAAEQSARGFFTACSAATYAGCGQPLAEWRTRFSGVPLIGSLLFGPTAALALADYASTISGNRAATGAEGLQMQIQTGQLTGALLPWLSVGRWNLRRHDSTQATAGIVAGAISGWRGLWGKPPGKTLVTSRGIDSRGVGIALSAGGETAWRLGNTPGTVGGAAELGAVTAFHELLAAGRLTALKEPRQVDTPTRADQVLTQMQPNEKHGEIEILRHEGPGGRSWSVLVRGTKEWGLLSQNPHDLLTNLQEVGQVGSDQRNAVIAAMEMAGIEPGEPVELVGHSQGGAVVANMAADPGVTERFRVASVLTAGSPTGGIGPMTGEARMLGLENLGDMVPGLDGRANVQGPGNVTVYFDANADPQHTRLPHAGPGGEHDKSAYIAAAAALEEGGATSDVDDFLSYRRGALRLEEATKTTAQYFTTQRVS